MDRQRFLPVVCILVLFTSIAIADWMEDWGAYPVNVNDWYSNSSWEKLAGFTENARIEETSVGGNATKKLQAITYNTVRYRHPIGSYASGDENVSIEVQARIAIYASTTHNVWPRAGHIIVGGVALGIGGNDISYQLNVDAATTAINESTVTYFTPATPDIYANTWYEIKIVINQVSGSNNDVADLYYKAPGDLEWNVIGRDLPTGRDAGNYIYVAMDPDIYLPVFENIVVSIRGRESRWQEGFENCILDNSYWYSPYQDNLWYKHPNYTEWARISNITVGSNTSKKLRGYDYQTVWYYTPLGDYPVGDESVYAEVTGSIAVIGSSGLHASWPWAGHIVVGGIALGIGGDDITYQILGSGVPGTINDTTVTRVATISGTSTWYDFKIVAKQVSGTNNDRADIYYKLSTNSNWINIATNVNMNRDLGDNLYVALDGSMDRNPVFDNINVTFYNKPATCGAWFENWSLYPFGVTDPKLWYNQTNMPWHIVSSTAGLVTMSTTSVGGDSGNKKLRGEVSSNPSWYYRKLTDSNHKLPAGDLTITAKVAVSPSVHTSWPLMCHIAACNVALGIGGDDITYQVLSSIPCTIDNTTVTRVTSISANTWYNVKIVVHPKIGTNNDTVDLYWKPVSSGTWNTIITNLATNHDIDGNLYVLTKTDSNLRYPYIDDVNFTGLNESQVWQVPLTTSTLSVNIAQTGKSIDRKILGQNLPAFGPIAPEYASNWTNMYNIMGIVDGTSERGVAGGLFADMHNWKNRATGYYYLNEDYGRPTVNFVKEMSAWDTELFITVNTRGTGPFARDFEYTNTTVSPLVTLAADWVRYTNYILRQYNTSNLPPSGSTDRAILDSLQWGSYNKLFTPAEGWPRQSVKYWEIGNEPEVPVDGFALSSSEYVSRYKQITAGMIAQDNTIKVGPCLLAPGLTTLGSLEAVLGDTNARVDFISYHPYTSMMYYAIDPTYLKYYLMDVIRDYQIDEAQYIRSRLVNYGRPESTPLVASEWNANHWRAIYQTQSSTMATAMGTLETIFAFADAGLLAAQYWFIPSDPFDGTHLPNYEIFNMMACVMPNCLVGSYFTDKPYRVYITKQAGGSKVVIWAMNFSDTTSFNVPISLSNLGFTPAIVEKCVLKQSNGDTSLLSCNGRGNVINVNWQCQGIDTQTFNPSNFTLSLEDATITVLVIDSL